MSDGPEERELFFLAGEIKTPPFSVEARREAGWLLRRLQDGESLGMPQSRPMPTIGPNVHELRVRDEGHQWRIIYRADAVEILVIHIFAKKVAQTPQSVIELCKARLAKIG